MKFIHTRFKQQRSTQYTVSSPSSQYTNIKNIKYTSCRRAHLERASGDVGAMQCLLAFLGGLGRGVFGVPKVLAGQCVDVDQVSEATERVLQHVRRQSARMADDEETLSVTSGVVWEREDSLNVQACLCMQR